MSPSDAIHVLGPAAAGAIIGVIAARVIRRGRAAAGIGWEVVPVLAGIAAAVFLLRGFPGLPPRNVNDWPMLLALPALIVGLCSALPWRWFLGVTLVHIALAAPASLTVALRSWEPGEAARWLPVFALPWLLLIAGVRFTAERIPNATLPALAMGLGVSAAVVTLFGHSASIGLFLGGTATAAGIVAAGRALLGETVQVPAVATAIAALAPSWWLLGSTLADLTPLSLAPLALAPLAAWVAWPWRARPWFAGSVGAIAAGLVAATAALLIS